MTIRKMMTPADPELAKMDLPPDGTLVRAEWKTYGRMIHNGPLGLLAEIVVPRRLRYWWRNLWRKIGRKTYHHSATGRIRVVDEVIPEHFIGRMVYVDDKLVTIADDQVHDPDEEYGRWPKVTVLEEP
jgi:hypothetical protein